MEPKKVFDNYLKKGDKEGAFKWVMEKLAWDPDSSLLLGMGALAFFLLGDNCTARTMAQEVLKDDPENEWALATLLAIHYRIDNILTEYDFFAPEGFRLDHLWIARFNLLGKKEEARKVIYCLSRFGSPAQKVALTEDWLVEGRATEVDRGQMELTFGDLTSGYVNTKKKRPGSKRRGDKKD